MRSNQNALELEVELDADDLLAPLGSIASTSSTEAPPAEAPAEYALDETSEIELTAEQMDALLEGRWPL